MSLVTLKPRALTQVVLTFTEAPFLFDQLTESGPIFPFESGVREFESNFSAAGHAAKIPRSESKLQLSTNKGLRSNFSDSDHPRSYLPTRNEQLESAFCQ